MIRRDCSEDVRLYPRGCVKMRIPVAPGTKWTAPPRIVPRKALSRKFPHGRGQPSATGYRPFMKKFLPVGCVLLVLLVCGLGGLALKGLQPAAAKTESAPVTVQRSDLKIQVVETGTLNANNVVELKSLVSGRLKALYVDEGDRVKAGQLEI